MRIRNARSGRCPECRGTLTYWRQKTSKFVCRPCGHVWDKPEPVVIATDNDQLCERFAVDTESDGAEVHSGRQAVRIAETASNDAPVNNTTANAVSDAQHVPPAPQRVVDPYEGLDPALRKEIELLRSKVPQYNFNGGEQQRQKRVPAR